jgi:integrase/recombinase XerD
MSQKPTSDLRRRMLEDMAVRRFSEKTKHDYIRHIEAFTRFLGRSPDTATPEDLRASRCMRWSKAQSRRR